jgi:D-tyrosyl-tRNA(Tyr) deacylase
MRAVVQRVADASVAVDGTEIARIGRGFVVLVGFARGDTPAHAEWLARKVVSLRIFEDESGRMSLGLDAVGGEILVVPQFTLYGDVRKGARPGFDQSAPPDDARGLYERFVESVRVAAPGRVATGEFQAHMRVALVNDGPVTILIEKSEP